MSKPSFVMHGPLEIEVPMQSFSEIILNSLEEENRERVALIDAHSGSSMTYGEILKNSIKLAQSFKQNDIKKNDIIAIVCENNLNYIIPVLATLYLGAIVQPVSPLWTLRELQHCFGISKPKWVICSESVLDKINGLRTHLDCIKVVITLGEGRDEVKSIQEFLKTDTDTENFVPEPVNPVNQVAFIFSSSGTTGLPKGVMITHHNCVATVQYWRNKKYGNYLKGDTTVVPMPFFHLFGMHMLLLSIVASVKFIMLNKFSPELYLRSIEEHRANKLACPPTLVLLLTKSLLVDHYNLSSIEDILCGSAPLKQEVEASICNRLNIQMRQTYATTETAGVCTMVPNDVLKRGSCGVLLPNLIAKVRDPCTKEEVGPNQTGELCFKGPIVMNGYMNNTKQTEDAFDKDGFYCTGDLGYYDEDGYFFIVGRIKELIKYKAYQVAPAELEDLLLSHPSVRDAAVIGLPDEKCGELPLAFVVKQPGHEVTPEEVIAFVSERVSPEKQLRGGVKFISEIPKNPSGKILRQRLKSITNELTIQL